MQKVEFNYECYDKSFEKTIAFHSAPTLLGIKAASIFTYKINKNENIDAYIQEFNIVSGQKGIELKVLCKCTKSALILVFRPLLLNKRLNEPERKHLLNAYGYHPALSLDEKLSLLSKRISSVEFPHEIGLFLDYPVHDVIGFINNNGENYRFCGYWKVYSNEKKAEKLFNNYTKCRIYLFNKLNNGLNLYQALKIA